MVIGSAYGVERIVHELFRLGFAEVREWSKPQPTRRTHEVMRVLTRYVLAERGWMGHLWPIPDCRPTITRLSNP